MITEHEVYKTEVFPFTSPGGNPCPIVLNAENLASNDLLRISAYYQLETGFVLEKKNDFLSLKYSVPNYEMEMCVHATIGSIKVLSELDNKRFSEYTIKTKLGIINSELSNLDNKDIIFVEQFKPVFYENNPSIDEVCKALNINNSEINIDLGPIQSVSTSRPKIIIPLINYQILSSLQPNFNYLWELCEKYDTTGFYPFTIKTRNNKFDVEARQFPKNAGYPEDPATGVAAGALSSYLTKYKILPNYENNSHFNYKIGQGFDMNRPSIIYTDITSEDDKITKVLVGGEAKIIRKEKITVSENKINIISN